MPIPAILAGAAIVAGTIGIGAAADGYGKMKDANKKAEDAQKRHNKNMARLEVTSERASSSMDKLGEAELKCIASFGEFADTVARIQNRPDFAKINLNNASLPRYDGEKLKEVSIGATALLGGLGGAALGTAGGFAAAGATTAAVAALGTASTGAAISGLTGVAATNATLAVLGGGTLAAGGGGVALGTVLLGAATLGVGLMVGGILFNFVGGSISDKADEAWNQMLEAEEKINKACSYMDELYDAARDYLKLLEDIKSGYDASFREFRRLVDEKNDANDWTKDEMLVAENSVLFVGLLHKMCKVQFVIQSDNKEELNSINYEAISEVERDARAVVERVSGTVLPLAT